MTIDEEQLFKKLSQITGLHVVGLKPLVSGYTLAKHYVVSFDNNSSLFAKIASNDDTRKWLQAEKFFYEQSNHPFHPKLEGWYDQRDNTILLLEDLSKAEWNYSWSQVKIRQVMEGIKNIAGSAASVKLPSILELHADLFCWDKIKQNPSIWLESGLDTLKKLEQNLSVFQKISALAKVEGNDLVHMDIRSDNICFYKDRAVFVDWNHVCIGNSILDLIFWLPTLYLEEGPAPWEFDIKEPEIVALALGYFVHNSSLPIPHEGSNLRSFQRKQAEVIYKWLSKLL